MKYSIIIPCYNVSNYIITAINSIPQRSDIEILIIDDGSTDNLEIVINSINRDLIYIKKDNGGVSSARNLGIKNASAEYIMFLDADDYYSSNVFNDIDTVINNNLSYNIYSFAYKAIYCDTKYNIYGVEGSLLQSKIVSIDFVKGLLLRRSYQHICSVIYKRDFLLTNDMYFNESVYYYEDLEFQIRALLKDNEVIYSNIVLFNYIERKGSAINSPVSDKALTVFDSLSYIKLMLVNNNKCLDEFDYFFDFTLAWIYKLILKNKVDKNALDCILKIKFTNNKHVVNSFNDFLLYILKITPFCIISNIIKLNVKN